jgi:BTB/POZ domain-containing protein 9
LLFGGLRESQPECDRVTLPDTSAEGFRLLLRYIYSGRLNLVELKEEQLLEQLGLAHRYGFVEFETAIVQYLKAIINVRNICPIYDVANLYSLSFLEDVCLNFMDKNASEVLASDSFLGLSENAICAVISRDSFCAPEDEIFRAVSAWAEANPEQDHSRAVRAIRLNIMHIPELLNVVRPSTLVSSDAILDAIDSRHKSRDMELNYRGYLIPEENVATLRHGAQVCTSVHLGLCEKSSLFFF